MKALGGRLVLLLLVAVAYVAAARLGFTLAFATKQVTAVWPPTGIAVAALLIWGNRVWPGIWLGAFASNALSSEPIWTAAAIAIGNTAAPLFGSVLLRRFGFDNALERVRDVMLLALFGAAIAMTLSATNGVLDLTLAGIVPWHAFLSVWWVWWTGDAMGVLVVAPLLLTWVNATAENERSTGGRFEKALLGATLLISSWVSFFTNIPFRFSVYPFVIWTALRFRQRETTAAIAIVFGIAGWATAHGLGPFSGSLDARLVQLDSWMSVLAITGLVLGATTAERRAARFELQQLLRETKESAERLQVAFLPERLPECLGLQCDALYIAAEREALIGGDWYDAFELPDGRIAFSIGDVTGHGLDAAVSAARLRQSIFVAAFETDDPADALSRADRRLRSSQDAPATALLAIVSRDLSSLSYASAGHPPPMLAAPNVAPRSLNYGGRPFGVGMPVAAKAHTTALVPGAVVLFYTDGLTEFNRDMDRAERDIFQALRRLVDEPVESPARFIQSSVMGSERPGDDTALLVVQRRVALKRSWVYDSRNSHDAVELRREIARFVKLFAPSDDELFQAELIIGEALANTVEHAPGTVHVDVDCSDMHPLVTISDAGPGLPSFAAALPAEVLSENGRGLFLISSLAREVKVEVQPGIGTKMRIVLPLECRGVT